MRAAGKQGSGLAFYIDGHVRVYHGELTKLPRHYVPRERLYLRATVDYWVNALDGQLAVKDLPNRTASRSCARSEKRSPIIPGAVKSTALRTYSAPGETSSLVKLESSASRTL